MGLWVRVLLGSFGLSIITTVAVAVPNDSYELYLAGIRQKLEIETDNVRSAHTLYPSGTVKSIVQSSSAGEPTVTYTYYSNGSLESFKDLKAGTTVKYARNGVLESVSAIRPFLSLENRVSELITGIRESGTQKLYPVEVDKSSFDKEQFVTGDYYFYREDRARGPLLKVHFRGGLTDGPITGYYESGKEMLSATLSNGILDGQYRRYQDSSLDDLGRRGLIEEGGYKRGVLDGTFIGYKEGWKWFSVTFNEGALHGPVALYSPGGAILEQCSFIDNKRSGNCKVFGDSGQVLVDGRYKYGNRDGAWSEWFTSGKTKKNANYEDGKLTGEVLTYSAQGTLIKKESYKDNKLEGPSYHYDTNGKLKASADYKDNKKDGFVTTYFPTGKVELKIPFKNGLRHGVQKRYYDSGELFEVVEFNSGRQVGLSQSFYKTGVSMGGSGSIQKNSMSYIKQTALDLGN